MDPAFVEALLDFKKNSQLNTGQFVTLCVSNCFYTRATE